MELNNILLAPVDYILADKEQLPPFENRMYQYIVGANGVFVRAKRDNLEAMIPVVSCAGDPIRGLYHLDAYIKVPIKVPLQLVHYMVCFAGIQGSGLSSDGHHYHVPLEILYWLFIEKNQWKMDVPLQVQTALSVKAVEKGLENAAVLLEIHSHHGMQATFSSLDNEEETGFRLYAVVGNLYKLPEIRARVSIYGHFWEFPATEVFELPQYLSDAQAIIEHDAQDMYPELIDTMKLIFTGDTDGDPN